ncbi:type IV pilus modification protein PilV [Neptuniibacter sp.]|uniref:type IV pilus modification protein PilV n=1 Tax=Neptuniibacter sp. TaxID=1962643 RepID=UPI00260A767E|nr:type IV pilus modification protein PilV [Neptuniibacter sp.]MCP4598362.1 type IV pilus modification protein PilV [Neptuniibacter sp.]
MPIKNYSVKSQQKGVSLIEVLVSLIIVSFVMLAIALYSMTGLSENQSAYFRSQANLLAYDIADRIRGNSDYALEDDDNYSIITSVSGDIPDAPNCISTSGGCTEAELAAQDLREWAENFVDVAGQGSDGGTYQALLPDAVGSVVVNGNAVTVTVAWQELDWDLTGGANRGEGTAQLQIEFMIF